MLANEWQTVVIWDKKRESLTFKEKLAPARQAVEGQSVSPPESGPNPMFDRELDG